MDGWITIGTKLETNKFDKQYADLENKIKKDEEKAELKLKAKLQAQRELDDHKQKILEIENEYEKLSQKIEHVQGIMEKQGKGLALTPQDFTDMQNYNELNTQYEKVGSQLDKMYSKQEQLNLKVARTSSAYQDVNDKITQSKQKLDTISLQRQQEQVSRFKDGFNGVGSSIQNAIHKVTRLALGVFGIRSAFLAVRRASSDLASFNPQYAANIEYIRYALTQMIAPVLEYILNLARTILAYINYIANAWFGVNLFARASAKSFNQVKRNIGGASSAAKELQKTLTGFDEMNILNSSSTGGGGGVGGGGISPDFDLADLDDIAIPEWIKWIAKNKDLIVGAIKAIAEALLIFKVLKIAKILSGVSGSIFEVIKGLSTFNKILLGLGITAIIVGIVMAVESLIKWIKEPTWENFKGVLIGLEIAAAGLAATLIALNASNPLGWIILGIDLVLALATAIADLALKESDEEKQAKRVQQAEENLKNARESLTDATNNYINAVDNAEDAERKLQEAQQNTGISIDDLLKKMDDENLSYKDLNTQQKEVYKAYINNVSAQDRLKTSTDELKQKKQEEADAEKALLYEKVLALRANSKNYDEYKEKVIQAYNQGKLSAQDAATAISLALNDMDVKTRQQFTEDLPSEISQGLNPNNYRTIASSFTSWWNNSFIGSLTKKVNLNFSASGSTKFGTGGYVTKLASGGLINMPNRGVPVTSAIAGEAGTEGIIPLTDQQAMAQLGAEIGRNVLVNLTNITSMNGRIISRELKTIQSEQDFAYNT